MKERLENLLDDEAPMDSSDETEIFTRDHYWDYGKFSYMQDPRLETPKAID